MDKAVSFRELIECTRKLQELFRKFEEKPWSVDVYAIELLAESGTLADTIMIKEGYRKLRRGQDIDLEDDISDVLFVLIMIAEHYGVDIEKAYLSMVETTRKKLEAKM